MNPRCETIGKYVVPLYRSLIAKELINTYKLTQVEAAQKTRNNSGSDKSIH